MIRVKIFQLWRMSNLILLFSIYSKKHIFIHNYDRNSNGKFFLSILDNYMYFNLLLKVLEKKSIFQEVLDLDWTFSKSRSIVVNNRYKPYHTMVFTIDGCSFRYAHTWSKSGISICWRHLVTSKESSNSIFFRKKTSFTSYVRNVKWATI